MPDVMFKEVVWRAHVLAKHQASARKVLRRAIDATGQSAEERSVEQHGQFPEQYVVTFVTPLEAVSVADAVFQTMLQAQRLGSGWYVGGPTGHDDGSWTFEMICAGNAGGRFTVPGIGWAQVIMAPPGQGVA